MPDDWVHEEIGGKSAYRFEPESSPVRFALLWLHDWDMETPPTSLLPLLRQHRLACVAPCGGSCWWVDRICAEFDPEITPEQHLLTHVVPWITSHWKLAPGAIAVAGTGMGGQGAVRLGLRHPDHFRVVASLNGAFDFYDWHGRGTALDDMYETRERCRQDTAVLQLDPYRWPPHIFFSSDPSSEWFRGNDRLHEKLRAYGVPHTIDFEMTNLDRGLQAMLAFVVNGLDRESRRLM